MTTYVRGEYHLHLFDRHLKKIKTIDHLAFMPARAEGEELILKPPYASYVVTRVITNSNDRQYPWTLSVTEEEDDESVCESGSDAGGEGERSRDVVLPES